MLCFRLQPADDASASWTKPNAIWPWGQQDARRKYGRAHGSLPTVQFTFSTPRYGSPSCSYSGAITIVVLCLYCILPDFTSGAIFEVCSLVLKGGQSHLFCITGLSHPFLGLGPGALGIGKNSGVFLKIGKKPRHILLSIYLIPLIVHHVSYMGPLATSISCIIMIEFIIFSPLFQFFFQGVKLGKLWV